jgi:bacillithiol system protein YtxJ
MSTQITEITTPEQLDQLFERSAQRRQLIFKHSLTCPISGTAHRALEEYLQGQPEDSVDYSLIAIQRSRPLSQAVAERLAVRHESPQALLVSEGQAVWNASHFQISAAALEEALKEAANA